MTTPAKYDQAFAQARSQLIKMALDNNEQIKIAAKMGYSAASIFNYCKGKGSNLRTYLEILEAARQLQR